MEELMLDDRIFNKPIYSDLDKSNKEEKDDRNKSSKT